MPRESVLRQLDKSSLTPFGRLIYDYLVSFQPSRDVAYLARQSGIAANTITAWLKYGILPKRQKIVQLSERVPDLAPLDELLLAAGLPTTAQLQSERRAHLDTLIASIRDLETLVDADPMFSAEDRAAIHHFARMQPERFVEKTNTWREWNHASPAQHEAQRATEDALVYEPEPITTPEQAHGVEPPPPRQRRAPRDQHRDTNPSGPYPRQR